MTTIEQITEWFEKWTRIKIHVHAKERLIYFRDKEIWWVNLGANIGFEQNGKNDSYERPILVFRKFGKDMLWAIPLTRQNKPGIFYFDLKPSGIDSRAILSQLRLISSKRLIRKIGIILPEQFLVLRAKVKELI